MSTAFALSQDALAASSDGFTVDVQLEKMLNPVWCPSNIYRVFVSINQPTQLFSPRDMCVVDVGDLCGSTMCT